MTGTAVKEVQARQKQSDASKSATLAQLKGKKRASEKFTIFVEDDDGEQAEVELHFRAIGATAYDKLVGKHPPTTEQRAEGNSFNLDTFGPALIAECCVDPEMSYADAKELWTSPDWSRGEVITLYKHAVDLCNRGMDIPFTVSA